MHYSVRSFIGRPSSASWSQYWENEPDDSAIKSSRGHLFGLVSLQTDDSNPSDLGHQLIQDIDTLYFSSLETPSSSWLKSTLETISARSQYQLSNITIILSVVHQDTLHLAIYNSGRIILQRNSQISPILQGQSSQIVTLSGPIHPEDRLIMSTDGFFDQYGWDRIKTFLSSTKIQDIEENFLSLLYSLDSQDTIAAAIIQSHSDEVQDITVPSVDVLPSLSREGGPPVGGPGGFFHKLFARKPIQVSHHDSLTVSRRHRLNIAIALILISVLAVSIYFGSVRNQASRLEKQYQSLKSQYQSKYDNALAIKGINLEESRTIAQDAAQVLSQMSSLNLHSDEVGQFQTKTQALLSQTGSSEAYKPDFFYDTGDIGGDAKYTSSYLSKSQLYLFDPSIGRLDSVDISSKSQKNIITSPDIQNAQALATDKDLVYLLKDQKILEIKNKTITPRIDLTNQITGFVSGQMHFWNSSLYLLASTDTTPTIWKFSPSSSGFSSGNVWLKENQNLVTDVSSFAINGSVWVIGKTGQINSYTLGTKDKIDINQTGNISDARNLVTSPDVDILAFSNNNLVYITKKTGDIVSSYNFGDKSILSLALSSSTKTLFVLCSDQKIYKIGL